MFEHNDKANLAWWNITISGPTNQHFVYMQLAFKYIALFKVLLDYDWKTKGSKLKSQ